MSLDLSAAVETIRAGWPGHHFTRDGSLFEAPPVRDGGATAELIDYAVTAVAPLIEAQVRAQVAADIEEQVQNAANQHQVLTLRVAACIARGEVTR